MTETATIEISQGREVKIQKEEKLHGWLLEIGRFPYEEFNAEDGVDEASEEALRWCIRQIHLYTDIPIKEMNSENINNYFTKADFIYVSRCIIAMNNGSEMPEREEHYSEEPDEAFITEETLMQVNNE